MNRFWNTNNLISKSTLVDCGPLSVEFFNNNAGKTPLDPDIFRDVRSTTQAQQYNLASLRTEDDLKIGSYPIKYRVYHTHYPENEVSPKQAFTVKIRCCRCDDALNLIVQPLPNAF